MLLLPVILYKDKDYTTSQLITIISNTGTLYHRSAENDESEVQLIACSSTWGRNTTECTSVPEVSYMSHFGTLYVYSRLGVQTF